MDELTLVFPKKEHAQEAWAYRQAYMDAGENCINGSSGLIHAQSYLPWLEMITRSETQAPEGWVPASTYFAFVEGKIVGTIQIRHELNEELLSTGGHIGYGVHPKQRRKGYATRMLQLALEKSRELGLRKVLITCDEYNIPSARTIEGAGGVFENKAAEEDGSLVKRYWITLED